LLERLLEIPDELFPMGIKPYAIVVGFQFG
jgi:hypothetical protein